LFPLIKLDKPFQNIFSGGEEFTRVCVVLGEIFDFLREFPTLLVGKIFDFSGRFYISDF
jgi:hypothetical protein